MFWKKKSAGENGAEDSKENSKDKDESRKSPDRESRDGGDSGGKDKESENAGAANSKKRLVAGASIGLLVLAGIGLTVWKTPKSNKSVIAAPSLVAETSGVTASSSVPTTAPVLIQPAPFTDKQLIKLPPVEFIQSKKTQAKDSPDDVEALRKENDVLRLQVQALLKTDLRQSEVDALKKENEGLKAKNDLLQVELQKGEKSRAEKYQSNIDAAMKKNAELQAKIALLKIEFQKTEKTQAEKHKAQLLVLTKKNTDTQVKIEILNRKLQQTSTALTAAQAKIKARPALCNGEMAIGSENPKEDAQHLKRAIEAISDGPTPQKAAK